MTAVAAQRRVPVEGPGSMSFRHGNGARQPWYLSCSVQGSESKSRGFPRGGLAGAPGAARGVSRRGCAPAAAGRWAGVTEGDELTGSLRPDSLGDGRGARDFVGVCCKRLKAKATLAVGARSWVGWAVPRCSIPGSPGREQCAAANLGRNAQRGAGTLCSFWAAPAPTACISRTAP